LPGHYVYLVRCADGSYYCGYAREPVARIDAHNDGKGSKILRGRLPVRLAYTRRLTSMGDALRFEAELKRRSHADKHALSRAWRKRSIKRG
jgi:putative endonuclease